MVHALQLARLDVALNVPDAHDVHWRSAVALPAVDTYFPAAQLDHAPQLAAFVVVLNVPESHGLH
jgi:hypothetical protein